MAIHTELGLRLPNSPGALEAVCRALAAERVNIVAMSLESNGQLRLVVDNPVRAAATLRDKHHQITERHVLIVPVAHDAGSLASILQLVAEAGVNVEYAYGAKSGTGTSALVVLGVDDAQRAAAATGV